MVYALAITIAAGALLLVFLGAGVLLVRRALGAAGEGLGLGPWRWYPSLPALLILLPLAGLLLWRFFPALLFIPIVLPFLFPRSTGRRHPPGSGRRKGDDAIEGRYRRLDDE